MPEKGARVVCGGKAHERGGNFFQPTILVDVPANAKVSKEETFGPSPRCSVLKMKPM